MRSYIGSFHFK